MLLLVVLPLLHILFSVVFILSRSLFFASLQWASILPIRYVRTTKTPSSSFGTNVKVADRSKPSYKTKHKKVEKRHPFDDVSWRWLFIMFENENIQFFFCHMVCCFAECKEPKGRHIRIFPLFLVDISSECKLKFLWLCVCKWIKRFMSINYNESVVESSFYSS